MRYKFVVTWGEGFSQKFHSRTEAIKAVTELLKTHQVVTIKNIYKHTLTQPI